MKHLSFLTLLALAFAGFASAQSVTVSRDTVYENFLPYIDSSLQVLEVRNTTSDTIFIDSMDIKVLTTNIDSFWLYIYMDHFENPSGSKIVGAFIRKSSNQVEIYDKPEFFAPESRYDFDRVCLDPTEDWCLSVLSARENPDSSSSAVWVDLKISFYFSDGDSSFFYIRGDYPASAVPIVSRSSRMGVYFSKRGGKYLINGKKTPVLRERKYPLLIIREEK